MLLRFIGRVPFAVTILIIAIISGLLKKFTEPAHNISSSLEDEIFVCFISDSRASTEWFVHHLFEMAQIPVFVHRLPLFDPSKPIHQYI